MNHALIGFIGGLLAFPHCIGMCGGFMVHLAGAGGRKSALAAHWAWLTGKIVTYTFAGAIAGYAGLRAQSLLQDAMLQKGISYLSGGIIFLAGLALLGLFPAKGTDQPGTGIFATLCRPLLQAPSPAGALILGMIAGLLPCPIVIGFLAYGVQSGSVLVGMAAMAGLGLGTAVPLMAAGGAGLAASRHLKRWGRTAGGMILILLGLTTVMRGTELFHHLLGCPSQPVFQQSSQTGGSKGCCAGKSHAIGNGN